MAIRLSPKFVFKVLFPLLLLAWLFVWSLGCAAADVVVEDVAIPVTGVDLSEETTSTATAPVSTGDVHGPLTNITIAGATPWTLCAVLGLLGLFQTRRHGTVTGALDRTIWTIKTRHYQFAQEGKQPWSVAALQLLKDEIQFLGTSRSGPDGRPDRPDRHERLIRKRLKRMK